MNVECPREHCHAPDTDCLEGHDTSTCPFLKKTITENKIQIDTEKSFKFPWNGNSLGLDKINLITAYSKPSLIGLVGQYSSGKTTLLATSYLILSNGFDFGPHSFTGSLTLNGWEQISSYLKFQGFEQPTFPPHTPLGNGRTPGILHLSLRNNSGALDEILITDPPGEWFEKWAINVNDDGAEGARWIGANSTHFILLIDSELMASDEGQIAKHDLFALAERLASVSNSRPVAIVWTKTDFTVNAGIKAEIKSRLDSLFSNREYFDLSIKNESQEDLIKGFQELWTWLLENKNQKTPSFTVPGITNNYFLDYRGSSND